MNHGANLAGISSVGEMTLPPNLFSGKTQTHHFTCEGQPSLASEYVTTGGATLDLFSGVMVSTIHGSIIAIHSISRGILAYMGEILRYLGKNETRHTFSLNNAI